MKKVVLFAFSALLLAGCGQDPLPPLPTGEQTIQGTLVPTDISLMRRGSHTIQVDAQDVYYVESRSVNLRSYNQKIVTLTGILERNTEPTDLPVLVVTSIEEHEGERKAFPIPSLGVTLSIPVDWDGRTAADRTFILEGDVTIPLVRVLKEDLDGKSFTEYLEQYPTAVPIVIQGKAAARITDETSGNQTVYILDNGHVLALLFTPSGHDKPDILRSEFLRVLQTMTFAGSHAPSSAPSSAQSSVGVGEGQPCGGSAGVICPNGFYCSITDFGSGIGRCKSSVR